MVESIENKEESKEITGQIATTNESEDVVTAFEIQATSDKGIDYAKLIDKYGCFPITPEQIERIKELSGIPVHRFIRRGIFFCQRDL